MAADDVYRVVAYTTLNNQTAINVFHYRVVAPAPVGLLQADVARGWSVRFATTYKALMNVNAAFKGCTAQLITVPPPPLLPSAFGGGAGPGAVAGDPLPTNIAGLITWKSLFSGRKNRGRSYIPFPSEGDNAVTSLPTAGYVAALTAFATLNVTPWTITVGPDTWTLQLCIWHQSTQSLGVDLLSYRSNQLWGQQHRRGDFGRPNSSPI